MAYIYKIYNDVNSNVYIGQTIKTIEERFSEHIYKSHSEKTHPPLHQAFIDLGEDKFHIELIEECSEDNLDEREKYWIKYYNSYQNGYNATIGGSGVIGVYKYKPVDMFDLKGNFEQHFESIKAACDFLGKPKAKTHISKVCHGERVTAYQHIWKFSEENIEHQTFCEICGKAITKNHKYCLYCQPYK